MTAYRVVHEKHLKLKQDDLCNFCLSYYIARKLNEHILMLQFKLTVY